MKKFSILLAVFAMLGSSAAYAQGTGAAANAGSTAGSGAAAWGVGLGALAVVGTVAGVTAASASSAPSTFSH